MNDFGLNFILELGPYNPNRLLVFRSAFSKSMRCKGDESMGFSDSRPVTFSTRAALLHQLSDASLTTLLDCMFLSVVRW